jgi:hypothetical protein
MSFTITFWTSVFPTQSTMRCRSMISNALAAKAAATSGSPASPFRLARRKTSSDTPKNAVATGLSYTASGRSSVLRFTTASRIAETVRR